VAVVNEPWFNNEVARPKTITDERLLVAAGTVVGRKGPDFTIADVAAQAGVSVGTIAQRFGSKSGLLQEMSRRTIALVIARMREVAAAQPDPAAGLRAALLTWFDDLADPEEAANHLAQLGVDLIDPRLRALLEEHYATVEGELCLLVRAADLPRAPAPERAARVLVGLVNGIAMDWSVRPRGPLAERMAQDVAAVLDAWRG
jgi:AcrR family transcriptional regulator